MRGLPLCQQHVFQLDVAVGHAARMAVLQRQEHVL